MGGEWSNTTVEDPLLLLPEGFTLSFEPIWSRFADEELAAVSADWSRMNGVMLVVAFGDPATTRIRGSAVMISPGVAVCAWHVFADRIARLQNGEWVTCLAAANDGEARIWSVVRYERVGETDLAILVLHLATAHDPQVRIHQSVVSARVPKVGEQLTIVGGVAAFSEYATRGTPDDPPLELAIHLHRGPVTNVFIPQRDRVVLPWPCVEIDAPSHGGMSGGPVFDERGALIGVLCTSFDLVGGAGPSYASLVYPALVPSFAGGWPPAIFQERRRLLESEWCVVEHKEMIEIQPGDAGTETVLIHY